MIDADPRGEWLELVPPRPAAPVVVEPLGDAWPDEPAMIEARLAALARALSRDGDYPFWLDSGLDVANQGRFSFLGSRPAGRFRSRGGENELWWGGRRVAWCGDPFVALRRILARRPTLRPPGAPPFVGGAIGFFGYDLRYHVERLPRRGRDDLGLPDCLLGFYDAVLAYDHTQRRLFLGALDPGGAVARGHRRLVEAVMGSATDHRPPTPRTAESPGAGGPSGCGEPSGRSTKVVGGRSSVVDPLPPAGGPLRANFTRPAYLRAARRVLDYIAAGDIYQVNLSQRFSVPFAGEPLALYERLRRQTPAPYAAYLEMGELTLLSASPERFLRIEGRDVCTRPIKGTRPRGATPEEDVRLAAELLASPKDRAELVMIVDLERNDLGRVCEYGTVRVPELLRLEAHPTVFHLVSTVTGRLRAGVTAVDCLRACFPGGSITGAPKIRAMEIIEELEPTHRGPYTGAIGYLGWDGAADLNIAIRTITLAGGDAHFQVGGGIVADSDPDAEYEETLHKGRALMRALGVSV